MWNVYTCTTICIIWHKAHYTLKDAGTGAEMQGTTFLQISLENERRLSLQTQLGRQKCRVYASHILDSKFCPDRAPCKRQLLVICLEGYVC